MTASATHYAPYRIWGFAQAVISLLLGLPWFSALFGVAMCTDGLALSYCQRLMAMWVLCGLCLLLNLVLSIPLIVYTRERSSAPARKRKWPMSLAVYLSIADWIAIGGLFAMIASPTR